MRSVRASKPRRIVALSAESADWLLRLGAWPRVVGVTAYFRAPPSTPKRTIVGGFSKVNLHRVLALQPDLAITFSDVQAGVAADLIRAGVPVLATNPRTLAEIEDALRLIAAAVGEPVRAEKWLREFRASLRGISSKKRNRPRVYFEEWNDPLISGIAWVGELIERAGGSDLFEELRSKPRALDRTVEPAQVVARNPQLIVASWCGKKADLAAIANRPGWSSIDAVARNRIRELDSAHILQPGWPLLEGFEQLKRWIAEARNV